MSDKKIWKLMRRSNEFCNCPQCDGTKCHEYLLMAGTLLDIEGVKTRIEERKARIALLEQKIQTGGYTSDVAFPVRPGEAQRMDEDDKERAEEFLAELEEALECYPE